MNAVRLAPFSLLILPSVWLIGCSKPPTLEEIEAQRRALPALYLRDQTLTQVTAPANVGMFVDEKTGEICYPAYECQNPDCPGRSADGKPYLFIHRDVLVSVDDNGELVWSEIPAGEDPQEYIRAQGGHLSPTCPKCFEIRDIDTETAEQKRQYQTWVKPHELPETTRRRADLDEAYQNAFAAREKLRRGDE